MLKALNNFKPSNSFQTAAELEVVIKDLDGFLEHLPEKEKPVFKALQIVLNAFTNLCYWIDASLKADAHPERFLNAAKGQAKLALEALDPNRFEIFSVIAVAALKRIKLIADWEDVTKVATHIQQLPIPTIYLTEEPSPPPVQRETHTGIAPEAKNKGPFVVKVMFDIERRPWSNSQILQAGIIYDLRAKLTIPTWPDGATHLILDYISTLSQDLYKVSTLQANRLDDESSDEFELRGHVEFPTPQNMLSDPLIIRVRATFFSKDGKEAFPATVVGYHQLRVRVSDKEHVPLLARYRAIDERNAQVIEEIQRTMPQLNAEHLSDFVEVLAAISNYMGVNLQQALYREGLVVSEADFQKNLLYHLRTWLGEQVREAPKQGGGPTDIQYKTVTIELKVEKEINDRRKMIDKYVSQPTQYSSASGAQLGILCILDLTEKDKPPANPQNQITLETPEVHGFDSTLDFPTKIAAVIIDGNLRLPSSYSH